MQALWESSDLGVGRLEGGGAYWGANLGVSGWQAYGLLCASSPSPTFLLSGCELGFSLRLGQRASLGTGGNCSRRQRRAATVGSRY